MSLNHLSSDNSQTLWWTSQHPPPPMDISPKSLYNHHHLPPTTTTTFNLSPNNHSDRMEESVEALHKEAMFEKPLTPSDVGKLNRLVIPKQHAEKYFPLASDTIEKGLLLSFEDELGKYWRFRYSYWNSSQSYVLTKGWSRFVKEKRLNAGDVVLFERHRMDGDKLFIGWRRRAVIIPTTHDNGGQGGGMAVAGVGGGWTRVFYNAQSYPTHTQTGGGGVGVGNWPGFPYQTDSCLHAVSNEEEKNNKRETTATSGKGRRLVRLFGVNLECGPDDNEAEPATPDSSSSISTTNSLGQGQAHNQYFSPPNHLHHMDMNMCRDVNQMRYQY